VWGFGPCALPPTASTRAAAAAAAAATISNGSRLIDPSPSSDGPRRPIARADARSTREARVKTSTGAYGAPDRFTPSANWLRRAARPQPGLETAGRPRADAHNTPRPRPFRSPQADGRHRTPGAAGSGGDIQRRSAREGEAPCWGAGDWGSGPRGTNTACWVKNACPPWRGRMREPVLIERP
jgi:hypothetical protein